MSEKPKRRFAQIHLSTAIILLFVLGLDMALWRSTTYTAEWDTDVGRCYSTDFGYPISCYWPGQLTIRKALVPILLNLPFHAPALALIAIAAEYVARRREARRP